MDRLLHYNSKLLYIIWQLHKEEKISEDVKRQLKTMVILGHQSIFDIIRDEENLTE